MVFRPLSNRRPPKPRRIFSLDRCDTAVSEVNGGLKPIILRITLNRYSLRKKSKTRSTRHYFLSPKSREVGVWMSFILFHHLPPMGSANRRATTLAIPRVVSRDLPISPRFTPTSFYRDAGSALLHLVNYYVMVELFVLTSSPFPLRKSEEKCTPAEIRFHELRLGERMLYPLDHRATVGANVFISETANA